MRTTYIRSCFAAALAALAASGSAIAQGNICVDLEAQLAEIARGAGSGGDPRQYDAPIAQQQDQIDRATAEAHRSGCLGGFLFFKPKPDPKCGKLTATINQMQGNLQRLMAQRAQTGGDPYTLASQRSDLLRSLTYNHCGSDYAGGNNALQDNGGGLFASLFGPNSIFRSPGPEDSSAGFGTYRTLCVRTCDGFYFPISFSTVPGQFNADAATCQAMCPGAAAVLYTHRNPGEDVSQMLSLDGQPYTALPNAFRFRTEYDKSCTCHAAGAPVFTQFPIDENVSPITGAPIDLGPGATTAVAVIPPLPNLRPVAVGEDPATIDDRAGGLIPAPVSRADGPAVAGDSPRKVRIVGPNYYYGQ